MMMKDDQLERLRAAYTAPGAGAPEPESHPEPDRIWQAVRGELPPEEIRETVDHVALCASCAEDWRIAMAFETESRTQDARPNVLRPSFTDRFRPWIAAAAAALVLTVGGIYLRQAQTPPPEYRGERDAIRPLSGKTLPREAFVLSWTPVQGAESYDCAVTTAELAAVAEGRRLPTPTFQVPAAALSPLPAGTLLDWRVTAVFPDGGRKQSPTFRTKLE